MATAKCGFGENPVLTAAGPLCVLLSISQARNPELLNPAQTVGIFQN